MMAFDVEQICIFMLDRVFICVVMCCTVAHGLSRLPREAAAHHWVSVRGFGGRVGGLLLQRLRWCLL